MSVSYTITLTEAQDKAFRCVAVDPQDFLQNYANVYTDGAIEEIVNKEIQKSLASGGTISGTKDDIILAADIKSAAQKQAEFEAAQAAKRNAQ